MYKLSTVPSPPVLAVITVAALAATIIIGLQFFPMEKPGGYGMVDYELGFTQEKAAIMLHAWGPGDRQGMHEGLLLDFAFMLAYALAFGGITLLIARRQSGGLASAGFVLTFAAPVAAVFDAVENLMLLRMLALGAVSPVPPLVAGICASIKFGLLLATILFWIACGTAWIIRRARMTA